MGQRMPAWADAACDDYAKRLPRDFAICTDRAQARAARQAGGAAAGARSRAHPRRLRRRDARRARRARRTVDQRELARHLARWRDDAASVAFVIGSADGLDPVVLRRAAHTLQPVRADAAARARARAAVRAALSRVVDAHRPPVPSRMIVQSSLATSSRPRNCASTLHLPRVAQPAPAGTAAAARRRVRGRCCCATRPAATRDVVEEAHDAEPPRHYVERIARTKASVGWQRVGKRQLPPLPVLGADTEVVLDDEVFGKPADATTPPRCSRGFPGARTRC